MFQLTTVDVRRLAYNLPIHLKIEHPFKNQCVGVDWLKEDDELCVCSRSVPCLSSGAKV